MLVLKPLACASEMKVEDTATWRSIVCTAVNMGCEDNWCHTCVLCETVTAHPRSVSAPTSCTVHHILLH